MSLNAARSDKKRSGFLRQDSQSRGDFGYR